MCVKDAGNDAHPRVKLLRMGGVSLRHPAIPRRRCRRPRAIAY